MYMHSLNQYVIHLEKFPYNRCKCSSCWVVSVSLTSIITSDVNIGCELQTFLNNDTLRLIYYSYWTL